MKQISMQQISICFVKFTVVQIFLPEGKLIEEKLKEIHPILTPQLMALGYAESEKWINAV